MRPTRHLGLESIDFQDRFLCDALTAEFMKIRELPYKDFNTIDETDPESPHARLKAVVQQHTKLNIVFDLKHQGPSVSFPKVDRNHPLLNAMRRQFTDSKDGLKIIKEAGGRAHGAVNLKTGYVSGVFTEIESTIYLPLGLLYDKKFSPEEIAAITLHEIGHVFVYFEFLTRLVTTNQVMAGISRALDKTSTQKEREVILLSAREALRIKNFDIEELSKTTDRRVVEAVLVSNVVRESRSELGSDIYDENSYEYLADQYATRYGAGRYLVTSLDKLYKSSWSMGTRSLPAYIFIEGVKLALLVASIGVTAVVGPVGLITAIYFVLIPGLADSQLDAMYDRPKIRLKRIRNQLVERQKLKDLPAEQHEDIKEDIRLIDDTLKDYNTRVQVLGLLAMHVFGIGKERFDAERLQQELESIAANDLFGRAHDLRNAVA